MTLSEFVALCDCVVKTGNSSHCMRLVGRPLDDLYYFLKKNPDERERLTMARSLFHDELTSSVRELAFQGIPGFRRGEKGRIVTDTDGEPIVDRVPNVQLIAAVLKEGASRLARSERNDLVRAMSSRTPDETQTIQLEIESDPPPEVIDIGKK
ncbi:hypothetical protein GOB93_07475 [Acetobacter musti]|uniref:Uncharacterized protein n=1 Tax=Acetobacter musti TaxID=864732 RepID=A0ABX0JNY4_9PROT|nr:hypothetical protein [Acetobacter musti]NHN84484.1 hypothetical protein [Acetobacter musti]